MPTGLLQRKIYINRVQCSMLSSTALENVFRNLKQRTFFLLAKSTHILWEQTKCMDDIDLIAPTLKCLQFYIYTFTCKLKKDGLLCWSLFHKLNPYFFNLRKIWKSFNLKLKFQFSIMKQVYRFSRDVNRIFVKWGKILHQFFRYKIFFWDNSLLYGNSFIS